MALYLVLKVDDHPDDSETRTIIGEHSSHDAGVALSRANEHARNLAQDDPKHAYDVACVMSRFVARVTVEALEVA
jgi:hypothetical protein